MYLNFSATYYKELLLPKDNLTVVMDNQNEAAANEVDAKRDLSEGELDEEDDSEPKSKRTKVHSAGDEEGNWEKMTKRQLKKRAKNKHWEKKKYQERADKYAVRVASKTQEKLLNTVQTELLVRLVDLIQGSRSSEHQPNQYLKTALFRELISSIVVGSPQPVHAISGLQEVQEGHKVLVVWLSMVSATYYKSSDTHFQKIKKLNPTVNFDLQHPGTNRFVKLGLEAFMMSLNSPEAQGNGNSESRNTTINIQPRSFYLFSLKELTENEFPNPSDGEVDQLGRCVSEYVCVRDWPNCDIKEIPSVAKVNDGEEDEKEKMPLFAIDCEMVETQNGSELARVSVVNEELECVFDTLVKPECPVLDYRTRFSGITAEILEDVETSLKDVQEKLLEILSPHSIFIGHSLENDFHALKFRHPFVIDTSLLFTPSATPTFKPSLRKLSKELLMADIQNSDSGHDSIEDAMTCMKLVLMKLKTGTSCKIAFNEFTPTLFTDLRMQGCTTGMVDKESVVRLFGKGSSNSAVAVTDEEAVEKTKEIVPLSKFSFVQLHGMENLFKSDSNAATEKVRTAAEELDDRVMDLVAGCSSKTVVFVVMGSGDIRKVRQLQQQEFTDFSRLKKEVTCARTGLVISFLVS